MRPRCVLKFVVNLPLSVLNTADPISLGWTATSMAILLIVHLFASVIGCLGLHMDISESVQWYEGGSMG